MNPRSIAELAAYGILTALLIMASFAPGGATATSSASASSTTTNSGTGSASTDLPTSASRASDRGRVLFATKGCIGCHMHAAFPKARMQVGPDLTALAERAATRVAGLDARAYVRQSLREPGAYRVSGAYTTVMLDLGLSDEQIESLTAFLLSPAR